MISRITIRSTDIFDLDTKMYLRRFPYSWINALHIQTEQYIIEQELLFKVGDRLNPFLVQETERNLRSLDFIRAARVRKFPQRDGTVALVVYVKDSWTTEPQLNLGGQNKVDKLEFGFKEKNLLGHGKNIQFLYSKEPGSIEKTVKFTDPRLFQSRWRMEAEAIDKTNGEEELIRFNRPYYSATTRWAAETTFNHNVEVFGIFNNNVRVSEVERSKDVGDAAIGTKVGGGINIVSHAGLRYRNERIRYSPTDKTTPNLPLPQEEDFQTVFLQLDTSRIKFVELTRIEKMTRVEDFNLGPFVSVSPGFSPRALTGNNDTTQFLSSFNQKWLISPNHFITLDLSYSGRDVLDEAINRRYLTKMKYYYQGWPRQTLVVHSRAEWGDKLDTDNQVKLGGDNGLRSYKVDEFVGSKSWLFNIEDRIFFIDELWHLVSVGGVVFYDAGFSWANGKPVALSDLKNSIGVGSRFGLTRSSNEVIVRMDIAYRLQRTKSTDDEWVFTFGSDHAF